MLIEFTHIMSNFIMLSLVPIQKIAHRIKETITVSPNIDFSKLLFENRSLEFHYLLYIYIYIYYINGAN
jgi:hypothetical protein